MKNPNLMNLPYRLDLSKPAKIHFIGIGGVSMSGIAMLLLKDGFTVTGSDGKRSEFTESLETAGAKIYYPQAASNIEDDIDAVVYTAAIHPDNPEYAECVRRGIPMLTRAQMLGEIMTFYGQAIGVAGTHGKTTTTSMVSTILLDAQTDPTIFVGGILDAIHGNMHIGSKDLLVTESCEYTNSFLSFAPTMEIILNIEEDHLDFFKDLADIRNSFRQFIELLPEASEGGLLVLNGEIANPEELLANARCQVLTYAVNGEADYTPANITYDDLGNPSFDVCHQASDGSKEVVGRLSLAIPGIHNVSNALAATALCLALGVDFTQIAASLGRFTGTRRRFEKKGSFNGVTVIDDYAHHPSEIRATLNAAAAYPHNKLWVVFQPHTYTRTKALYADFLDALSSVDELIIADIYAARETDTLGVSAAGMVEEMQKRGISAHYLPSFADIEKYLSTNCIHGDLLITMGAGDVVNIGEDLVK